jgi:hypothetical protein
MDALADNWESVAQIQSHVHQSCGPTPVDKLLAVLRELRWKKLITLMSGAGETADTFEADPSASWFGMTEAGRNAWRSERAKYHLTWL